MRFRLLVIGIGFVLIGMTYTFPLWIDTFQSGDSSVIFPGLTEAQLEQFALLPAERQNDYLTLARNNPSLALNMVTSALAPPVSVPLDEQENPEFEAQQAIRRGVFTPISPNRGAEGTVIIYELPDGRRYLWLENFNAIPAPNLRLFLSPSTTLTIAALPRNEEFELSNNELLLDPLRATVGNQMYDVPREARLSEYNSVLIYSLELDLLWSVANIR